ncbi:YcxB-like protein [Micromonospora rhizosphaerae]|uniref:YcxB-like protein n=1 Tax=Micromonospora rhizosphaerae TaxID=568872 RepID=A0A1C6RWL1_9ACTN|nr:YcxB family protein [Micromonospora rhizosphaerae]SCL21452.1 YcxB-like protein [Micromonospora rhizosphaerae]
MLIRFDAAPDRVRLNAAYRRLLRGPFRPYRGTGVVLCLLAVVALVPDPAFVAPILAGAGVLFIFFSPALMLHRVVTDAWRFGGLPSSWEISEEGLRCATERAESLIRWTAVTSVERLPDQLLLRLGAGHMMAVPLVGLSTEQRDELMSFIQKRGLLGGRSALVAPNDQGSSEAGSDR